jgi:hypothetical protein
MNIDAFLKWLEAFGFATAIRESEVLFPWLESLHVLAIVLVVGSIAISEAQGIPNGGDMHIKERMYLQKPEVWADELTITAPKVLTKPWVTTRIYYRQRLRRLEIVEGTCLEGWFKPAVDKDGYPTWERIEHDKYGNRTPPK